MHSDLWTQLGAGSQENFTVSSNLQSFLPFLLLIIPQIPLILPSRALIFQRHQGALGMGLRRDSHRWAHTFSFHLLSVLIQLEGRIDARNSFKGEKHLGEVHMSKIGLQWFNQGS